MLRAKDAGKELSSTFHAKSFSLGRAAHVNKHEFVFVSERKGY